ncbi:MAG: hypothetical protein VKL39_02615, partial [Leptolyngbyaceae bacterium]|nr:hypothetical protein [Leptolyngbyaceae bacterium]
MSKFFTIDSAVLVTLLRVANHAVPTRGVNPILQCIHLEVSNGQLIAHTTDMEVAFRQKTDQIGDCQDGIAVVDIAKLIAIASANKGDMVFSMGK